MKEVEEALQILNGDIKGYYISQKQNGISEKYEIAIETVLGYVKELEKGITRLKDKNKKLSEEIIDVKVNKVTRNFIPKSKIRDKIEELEKEKLKYDNEIRIYTMRESFDFQEMILNELLEEE